VITKKKLKSDFTLFYNDSTILLQLQEK